MNAAREAKTQKELIKRVSAMTSVVSYPKRCSLWGSGSFRGNCDGRLFLALALRYGAKRVADPMMGSGTTRDVVAWLNKHQGTDIKYWGADLKTGFNLYTRELPSHFDLVWLHPPYWNIIRYSDDPADLSSCDDYECFRQRLCLCLERCFRALDLGGRLAVLVGDVRKRGRYTPIVRDVLNMEDELGPIQSVIIKTQHACRSDWRDYRHMPDVRIRHEYCVVFRRDR